VSVEPVAKLRNQLLRRPAGTVGLVFSRSGFAASARILAQFLAPQTILLWQGEEVRYALEQEKIVDFLVQKYRACVEKGIADENVTTPAATRDK
jgi:hypothetical protein